jgi:hypothetical protein
MVAFVAGFTAQKPPVESLGPDLAPRTVTSRISPDVLAIAAGRIPPGQRPQGEADHDEAERDAQREESLLVSPMMISVPAPWGTPPLERTYPGLRLPGWAILDHLLTDAAAVVRRWFLGMQHAASALSLRGDRGRMHRDPLCGTQT